MKYLLLAAFAAGVTMLTACQPQNSIPKDFAHMPIGVKADGKYAANDPYSRADIFFEKNCKDPEVDVRVVSQGVFRGTYEELEKLHFIGKKIADARAKGCGWPEPATMHISAHQGSFNGPQQYKMVLTEQGKLVYSSIPYQPPQPVPAAPPSALEQIFSSDENFSKAVIGLMMAPVVFCNQNPNDPMCQRSSRSYTPPTPEKEEAPSLWEEIEKYEPIEDEYYAPPPAY